MGELGNTTLRILIVDDEIGVSGYMAAVSEEMGFDAVELHDGNEFPDVYRRHLPDVLILDINVPGTRCTDLLDFLKDEGCTARIFVTSGAEEETLREVMDYGSGHGLDMSDFWPKPVAIETIEEGLSKVLDLRK